MSRSVNSLRIRVSWQMGRTILWVTGTTVDFVGGG